MMRASVSSCTSKSPDSNADASSVSSVPKATMVAVLSCRFAKMAAKVNPEAFSTRSTSMISLKTSMTRRPQQLDQNGDHSGPHQWPRMGPTTPQIGIEVRLWLWLYEWLWYLVWLRLRLLLLLRLWLEAEKPYEFIAFPSGRRNTKADHRFQQAW
jgi:hypothetical protein